jgi:hypothetical protein
MMGYLDGLKIVTATKPEQSSPLFHRRNKLVEKLYEQMECVKAKSEGRDHFIHYMRNSKAPTGETLQSQMVRKVRPWWYRNTEGKLVLEVRYANKRLELAKGKTGVEVETLANMASAIELVIKAVQGGEMDVSLNASASNFRASITK